MKRMALEIRIYPNKAQEEQISKTFGCCRWVYNQCLDAKEKAYERRSQSLTTTQLCKLITLWKHSGCYDWLSDADSVALQQEVRHLMAAYERYFRNIKANRVVSKKRDRNDNPVNPYGKPRFKAKYHSKQSYTTMNIHDVIRVVDSNHVHLPKLGVVKARVSKKIDGRITSATIKKSPTGKYYVVLAYEVEIPCSYTADGDDIVGVDVGIKNLMTLSDGTKVDNSKFLDAKLKKLEREQRRLSRRQGSKKGETKSKRFLKQQRRVARTYEQIANSRKDHIHKATTAAVRKSHGIAVEDLNVKGMLSNHHLARSISDAALAEIHRQLRYKCDWAGVPFVEVGAWYPSSKQCSKCGYVNNELTLSDRMWECPECHEHHDRDLNAALNIRNEGIRILEEGTVGHTETRSDETRP